MSDDLDPRVDAFLEREAHDADRAAAPVGADEARASARGGRSRRRGASALALAAVLALIAGSVVGFTAGRASAPRDAGVATAGDGGTTTSTPPTTTADGSLEQSGGSGFSVAPAGPLELLFVRPAPGPILVRAYSVTLPDSNAASEGGACAATGLLQVELSSERAVTFASAQAFDTTKAAPLYVAAAPEWGDAEGAPAQVWIVRVNDGAATVSATFTDGSTDETRPTEGWAAVAAPWPARLASVATADASGHFLTRIEGTSTNPMEPPSCGGQPPPTTTVLPLPDAGTPPADEAKAKDGVTKAYDVVFAGGNADQTVQFLEDGPALLDTLHQARDKAGNPQAGSLKVEVGEIRFTDDHHAALYFTLTYQGSSLGQRLGYAVLDGDQWKVARSTMCEVLAINGVICPG